LGAGCDFLGKKRSSAQLPEFLWACAGIQGNFRVGDDPTAAKDSLVHFLFQSFRIHQTMISTSARVSNFRFSLLIVLVLISSRPAFCGKIHEAVKKDANASFPNNRLLGRYQRVNIAGRVACF
jgi:hypothetical protein